MNAVRFAAGGYTTIGANPNREANDDYLLIDRDLGHLPPDIRKKLVYSNVKNLYDIEIAHPVQ